MKKAILLLVVVLGFGLGAFAQGNLQFNDVKLFTWANTTTSPYTSPLYTVPAGKVWKIEAAGTNGAVSVYEINGQRTLQPISSNGGSAGGENLPIWLPSGATIQFAGVYSSSGLGSYVSILEFNVAP